MKRWVRCPRGKQHPYVLDTAGHHQLRSSAPMNVEKCWGRFLKVSSKIKEMLFLSDHYHYCVTAFRKKWQMTKGATEMIRKLNRYCCTSHKAKQFCLLSYFNFSSTMFTTRQDEDSFTRIKWLSTLSLISFINSSQIIHS